MTRRLGRAEAVVHGFWHRGGSRFSPSVSVFRHLHRMTVSTAGPPAARKAARPGRVRVFSAAAVLLLFPGAALARDLPRLNSERIEARFGSYGIEVLESEPVRVSMLYSTHEGRKICRTLALVMFGNTVSPAVEPELRRVRAGASLGATFREAGWAVEKRHLHLGSLPAGPRFAALAQLGEAPDARLLAVAVYELTVARGQTRTAVAMVVEIHHPDYLTLSQLEALAGVESGGGGAGAGDDEEERVTRSLDLARSAMAGPLSSAPARTEAPLRGDGGTAP